MKSILVLIACGAMTLAQASDLRGEVTLANGSAAPYAVVYVEGAAKSSPLKSAKVDQRERTFIPHVSVVTAGTTVAFPNNDTIFHNVFADYDAKRFDLGMYPRGKTKLVTFPNPGLVALMCSVHPDMSAYIMVVDTPYYAVADAHGRYKISDLPDGDYLLKAWHESGQVESRPIHIRGSQDIRVIVHRA